ncbi:TSUP family transporter [Arsenicicoccus sp. oral taxon 190]|uniref:TSUP family transporter n=1 Tax=Arsenicicoccus sp. oral taxon 190 TaxID=1658671 RepID=UPI00067A1C7A|nr:TSUP family transporter [Arsenicicoccus sp. oral taxon 190]AKT52215.1 membrane protein [Arsenicicoccus sp. oral taxon 190]
MGELSLQVVLLLVAAAFGAGWVDAVVGGGGLIQLPALLLGLPGASPAQILATNKLASICGTSTSAITYYRRVRPDLRTAIPLALAAFAGSSAGAVVATRIPKEAFNPIILVALVVVGSYTVLKPSLGAATQLRFSGRHHLAAALMIGVAVGFYDGALGPGTGSFFVFALVGLTGYAFLEASAKAKIANFATNLAALVVFVPHGAVVWPIGLVMGLANIAGGYLGARTAVSRGAGFVRVIFIVVVSGFVVRIGGQLLGRW